MVAVFQVVIDVMVRSLLEFRRNINRIKTKTYQPFNEFFFSGEFNCVDFSDEDNCNVTCASDEYFKCPNHNICISKKWLCDGDNGMIMTIIE